MGGFNFKQEQGGTEIRIIEKLSTWPSSEAEYLCTLTRKRSGRSLDRTLAEKSHRRPTRAASDAAQQR